MSTTEPEASQEESSSGAEPLLEVATPEIYKHNAFRILGLPVDATPRDIARHAERLQLRERLGSAASAAEGILPLEPAPGTDMIREAMQRLRTPERRLVDEFFWFWPLRFGESRTDPALTALAGGNMQAAVDIWHIQEEASDAKTIAMHNLAILAHMLALEPKTADLLAPAAQSAVLRQDAYWQEAFQRWQWLGEDEGFWNRLTTRIRDLDDPRLTTGLVRSMRTTLPIALLLINAQLALRASERGEDTERNSYLHVMREAGFESTALDEALSRVVVPTRERLKALYQIFKAQVDVDPAEADQVIERFVEQASSLLAVVDALLPVGHLTRDGAHDEVALSAFESVVRFGNTTENWQRTLHLFKLLLGDIATSPSVRQRIEESIEAAEQNFVDTICWYCKKGVPEESAVFEGGLHRITAREGATVQYDTATVKVPRCSTCKSFHDSERSYAGWGAVLGFGLGGGFSMYLYSRLGFSSLLSDGDIGPWVLGLILGLLAWFVTVGALAMIPGWFLGRGIARAKTEEICPDEIWIDFPRVQQLRARGWKTGSKPPGVQ